MEKKVQFPVKNNGMDETAYVSLPSRDISKFPGDRLLDHNSNVEQASVLIWGLTDTTMLQLVGWVFPLLTFQGPMVDLIIFLKLTLGIGDELPLQSR